MRPQTGQLCDRARHWASLRVDGELSQLESALLDAHLAWCAECLSFARDVTVETETLRAAALVPVPAALDVHLPRRRGTQVATALAGAAAVLAAMMVGGALRIHSLVGGASEQRTAMISSSETSNLFRDMRRVQLIAQEHPIPRNKDVF